MLTSHGSSSTPPGCNPSKALDTALKKVFWAANPVGYKDLFDASKRGNVHGTFDKRNENGRWEKQEVTDKQRGQRLNYYWQMLRSYINWVWTIL